MFKSVVIAAAVAAAAIAAPAFAQTNVALGKTVTGTPFYDSGTETFTYQNITDGLLNDSGGPGNWSYWLTPNGAGGTAVIDLGGLYDLSRIYVQNTLNRPYYQDREAAHVDFYSSTVAPTLGTTSTYGSLLHSTTFDDTTHGNDTITYADFNFAPTIGQYVTVDITSFYGSGGGLNEVQVYGSAVAVPEPATWAMMMLGFGMVGFGLRHRRKQTVRVTYA